MNKDGQIVYMPANNIYMPDNNYVSQNAHITVQPYQQGANLPLVPAVPQPQPQGLPMLDREPQG